MQGLLFSVLNNPALAIATTSCGNELPAAASCVVNVKATSNISGLANLSVNYTQAADITDMQQTGFRYIHSAAPLKFDIEHLSGDLRKSVLNRDNYLDLRIHNLSKINFKQLTLDLSGIPDASFVVENDYRKTSSSITIANSNLLGEFYPFRIKYSPTSQIDVNSLLKLKITVIDQNNDTSELNWSDVYSTLSDFNMVSMTPRMLELRSIVNNPTPMLSSVAVHNISGLPASLAKAQLIPIAGYNLPDALSIDDSNCASVLAPDSSCKIKVSYQPTEPYALRRADLVLPVGSLSGSESPTMHAMNIYAKALSQTDSNPADITVSVSNNNANFISGSGSITDPYNMIYSIGRELKLTYTFTNRSGAGTAYRFNAATNYLPIGTVEISIFTL